MRNFTMVPTMLWQSTQFASMLDAQRLLYLFIYCGPHANSAGVYRLPAAYACADLGWDPKKYRETFKALLDADMILSDANTEEVMVVHWFKHNYPTNSKHRAFVERVIREVRSKSIADAAEQALLDADGRPKIVPTATPATRRSY